MPNVSGVAGAVDSLTGVGDGSLSPRGGPPSLVQPVTARASTVAAAIPRTTARPGMRAHPSAALDRNLTCTPLAPPGNSCPPAPQGRAFRKRLPYRPTGRLLRMSCRITVLRDPYDEPRAPAPPAHPRRIRPHVERLRRRRPGKARGGCLSAGA